MKIIIKIATKYRINQCVDLIQKCINYAETLDNIRIIVSVDEDDFESIKYLENNIIHNCVQYFVGPANGKIAAINRDIPESSKFDIIMNISDDMTPIYKNYDTLTIEKMKEYYPDTDGVLFFNDGYLGPKLNTICILGAKYYARFNYIYQPDYKSLWCDNEFMKVAYDLNKQTYIHTTIFKHEHPANNRDIKSDILYDINQKYESKDKELFQKRNPVTIDLSIMICTIPERKELYNRLITRISNDLSGSTFTYEIISNDSIEYSVGLKRELLLFRANGNYSCFIDDDDDITPYYFTPFIEMLQTKKYYDSLELRGLYFINGAFQSPFEHSTKHSTWDFKNGIFIRFINHLNIIKTSISRRISYKNLSEKEDITFSESLFKSKLIKSCYYHNYVQYLYYYSKKDNSNPSVESISTEIKPSTSKMSLSGLITRTKR